MTMDLGDFNLVVSDSGMLHLAREVQWGETVDEWHMRTLCGRDANVWTPFAMRGWRKKLRCLPRCRVCEQKFEEGQDQ